MLYEIHLHIFKLFLSYLESQHASTLNTHIVQEKPKFEIVVAVGLSAVLPESQVFGNFILVNFPGYIVDLGKRIRWIAQSNIDCSQIVIRLH